MFYLCVLVRTIRFSVLFLLVRFSCAAFLYIFFEIKLQIAFECVLKCKNCNFDSENGDYFSCHFLFDWLRKDHFHINVWYKFGLNRIKNTKKEMIMKMMKRILHKTHFTANSKWKMWDEYNEWSLIKIHILKQIR